MLAVGSVRWAVSRPFRLAPALEVQPDIQNRRTMGQPADGDEIDAGCGNNGGGFRVDPAGGFGDRTTGDEFHRFTQLFRRHIVQKNGIDAFLHRLAQLCERIDLHLDLDEMPNTLPGAADSLTHTPATAMWLSLMRTAS